jgi:hypothetical protein
MPAKKAAKKASRKAPAKKAAPASRAGKGEADAGVKAWIAGAKPRHGELAQRIDKMVADEVPGVTKAVKWDMLFWGIEGKGWIARFASWKAHASLRFYAGTSLTPLPPEGEPGQDVRGVRIPDGEALDEKQVRAWLRQAAKLPGWGKVKA